MSGDEEVKLTGRIGQVDLKRNGVLLKEWRLIKGRHSFTTFGVTAFGW
jgi:hypothetical protein